ncbi:hypothetical protein COU57_06735 [Candidatus Pacearchaeota archaeon CG10_big_fil_rev_8_21_14_0_10_32_14]|nr:MAG: hypothetical protein COU57_06735 [Candidatus Pacearchaeota archaeon CG10_big_fil_rev_8_21_14_0_10_32_14]
MGLIRGGLFIFVSILLFVTLIVGGVFLILSLSLSYDNVNVHAKEIIKQQNMTGNDIPQLVEVNYPSMKEKCVNSSSASLSNENFNYTIPCSVVNESSAAVVDYGIDLETKEIYYKKYDCGLFDCINGSSSGALSLVSKQAKSYWTNKFIIMLLFSLVLSCGLFFLAHKKNNFFIFSGIIFIFSGFVLLNIQAILIPVIKSAVGISSEQMNSLPSGLLDSVIRLFFNKSAMVFWIYLILGLILLISGIFLKLWNFSYGISKFFRIGRQENTTRKVTEIEQELNDAEDEIKRIKKKK